MNEHNFPYMKQPCKNCPFRKDTLEGWLGKERMEEILDETSFVCHKTAHGRPADRMQCAGHMIMLGNENEFIKTAKEYGIQLNLKGQELVFDTKQDCIDHHIY